MTVHSNKCGNCHTTPPLLQDPANRPRVVAITPDSECIGCHGATYFTGPHGHNHAATVTATALCVNCHTGDSIITVHNNNCFTCHSSANGARIVGINGNGDATINGGNGGSCASCHATYFNSHNHDHNATVAKNLALTPTTVNCAGCHSATASPFVGAGQVHAANACATCHNTSTTGALKGSALNGTGECKNCHTTYFTGHDHGTTGGTVDHAIAINPATDLSQLDSQPCSNCHSAQNWPNILSTHFGVCTTCHNANRDINPAAPVGVTVNYVIASYISGTIHCLDCHLNKGATVAHGSVDHSAAGLSIILDTPTCVAVCHPANNPMSVHNSRCSSCHTAPPSLEDPANRPWASTIIRGATCSGCHATYFNSHSHNHTTTVTATVLCVNCHTGNLITSVHSGCASCHDPANGNRRVGVNGNGDATINSGNGGTCAQCHLGYFNSHAHDHNAQVKKNVATTPSTANCIGCHIATNAPFVGNGEVHTTNGCATCHNTTTNGSLKSPAIAGGGECISCHSSYFTSHDHGNTGGAIDHTVMINPATDLGQSDSQPCSNCHSVQNWPNILTTHFGGCATCHNAGRDVNPSQPTGTSIPMVIANANQTTVHCLNCHQDKTAPAIHLHIDHSAAGLGHIL
ncbi:MAG: hypothetical protein Q8J76_08900, partial [Desulfobulbaceae bacterium]|nr:hypothetical protein [Desulfobulbaceae bacterium]